jgi:hypothetical protein
LFSNLLLLTIYSETCLNQTSLGSAFVFRIDGWLFLKQVIFKYQLRQVSLYKSWNMGYWCLLYRYRWNTMISKLNKNDFYFHSRYISRHFVVDVIWRLPVWNIKSRRYLASCMLQFGSNLTKIIFQGKHLNYFIVVGGWHHVFWSDTHYSISLRYTRNIVQLNSI